MNIYESQSFIYKVHIKHTSSQLDLCLMKTPSQLALCVLVCDSVTDHKTDERTCRAHNATC